MHMIKHQFLSRGHRKEVTDLESVAQVVSVFGEVRSVLLQGFFALPSDLLFHSQRIYCCL